MWRILFLILILFSPIAFSQTQEKSQVIKFDEFGKISESKLKQKLDDFNEKVKEQKAMGYIIISGKNQNEKTSQIKKIIKKMNWFDNCFGSQRYVINENEIEKKLVTTFWIVPQGAELPNNARK